MILRAHAHFWPFSKSICLLILCKDNHLELVVFDSPEGGGGGGGGGGDSRVLTLSLRKVTGMIKGFLGLKFFILGICSGGKLGKYFLGP